MNGRSSHHVFCCLLLWGLLLTLPGMAQESSRPIPAPNQLDGVLYFEDCAIRCPEGFGWLQVPVSWGDYYLAINLAVPINPPFSIEVQTYEYAPETRFGRDVLTQWVQALYGEDGLEVYPEDRDFGAFEEGAVGFRTETGVAGVAALALSPEQNVIMLLGRGEEFDFEVFTEVARSLEFDPTRPEAFHSAWPDTGLVDVDSGTAELQAGTLPVPEGFRLSVPQEGIEMDAVFFIRGVPLASVAVIAGPAATTEVNQDLAEAQAVVYLEGFATQAGFALGLESVTPVPEFGDRAYLARLSGEALSASGGLLYLLFREDCTITFLFVGDTTGLNVAEVVQSFQARTQTTQKK